MLRKIPTDSLRVGMHVHEVCGSWLEHPFWRGSFKVTDEDQIRQLGAIREVIIDTDKGRDVDMKVVHDIELPSTDFSDLPEPVFTPPSPPSEPVRQVPTSFKDELARAGRVLAKSREAMQTMFQDARMGKALDTEHCLPLVNEIADSVERNPGALVSLARLKTSDAYTFMHSAAVCALMVSLARQLKLSESQAREAGMAGLVHDMGKALMPLEVLNKPGALTQEEFAIMKSHPEEGYKLLKEGGGVGPVALDVCLHHHEKINGRGYPKGLKGDEISLYAKMGAVCDVYDAITSNRPYKAGWDPADSLMKMAAWTKEGHFDDRVFQAFVKSIGIYPTGSLVKLQSGRLAVVVEQGSGSLLSPIVRVFFSTKSNQPIPVELLDLGKTVDQIVSRESKSQWGFQNLDQLWNQPG
ncbi:HD-GYP domain-containing protein [Aquabacterium sp. G14]|uniref:HD-GYP domain-containing protein n=1 Tax=Aquabacterium sp. G14 TaxID=3130164 RepID=UPI0030961410